MTEPSSPITWPAGGTRSCACRAGRGADTQEVPTRAAPFFYGRWDDAIAAHVGIEHRTPAAAQGFYADGAFEPEKTRANLPR